MTVPFADLTRVNLPVQILSFLIQSTELEKIIVSPEESKQQGEHFPSLAWRMFCLQLGAYWKVDNFYSAIQISRSYSALLLIFFDI